jgi:hypothetical protein
MSSKTLDKATLRRLSVESESDPRTVQKEFLVPGSVKGLPGHRIRRVLAAHGLASPKSVDQVMAMNRGHGMAISHR